MLTTSNPIFDRITDIEQKELARLKTSVIIADAHAKVYAFVSNETNKYDKIPKIIEKSYTGIIVLFFVPTPNSRILPSCLYKNPGLIA